MTPKLQDLEEESEAWHPPICSYGHLPVKVNQLELIIFLFGRELEMTFEKR